MNMLNSFFIQFREYAMPKRTNEFQSLIYLIQSQLTKDATVTESGMLVDKDTGDLAEVDVVVRAYLKIRHGQKVVST